MKVKNNPKGIRDFGADDNTSVEYARDNNFYYILGQAFQVPTSTNYKLVEWRKKSIN